MNKSGGSCCVIEKQDHQLGAYLGFGKGVKGKESFFVDYV